MQKPDHIGFIMDGNGRWATERNYPRSFGHRQGVIALKDTVKAALEFEIPYITVFAFSTENFSRPKDEVESIMKLIIDFNKKELNDLVKNNVRVRFLGDREGLDKNIVDSIKLIESTSECCNALNLNIAFNYSGRDDILQAVNKAVAGKKEIDLSAFENLLYTKDIPEPDLIVRTGGEKRISNFMLFQAAYAELIFLDLYWPDFNKIVFEKVLSEYGKRKRRFGSISSEDSNA